MKTEELRTKSISELKDLLLQQKKEAMNFRFQKVNGVLESVTQVKLGRRMIARIKTILSEKTRAKVIGA